MKSSQECEKIGSSNEIELYEFPGNKTLRQFILNEEPSAKTTLIHTATDVTKKGAFIKIFIDVLKKSIEQSRMYLFPIATAMTFAETIAAWKKYQENLNQNATAKWELFMAFATAAKEAAAVIIGLAFAAIPVVTAPIMFLFIIGKNIYHSAKGIFTNLKNLWTHSKIKDSYFYQEEKEALKNNIQNFILSSAVFVAIVASFLAPGLLAVWGIALPGITAAAYGINLATISVIGAALLRPIVSSIVNKVTDWLGFNKPKKQVASYQTPEYFAENFTTLQYSHIDDLILKIKYLKKEDAKEFLKNLIEKEQAKMRNDDLTKFSNQYKWKEGFFLKLMDTLNDKKTDENAIKNLIRSYQPEQLKLIMTSDHEKISGTQKLAILFDEFSKLRPTYSTSDPIAKIEEQEKEKESKEEIKANSKSPSEISPSDDSPSKNKVETPSPPNSPKSTNSNQSDNDHRDGPQFDAIEEGDLETVDLRRSDQDTLSQKLVNQYSSPPSIITISKFNEQRRSSEDSLSRSDPETSPPRKNSLP